MIQTIPCEKVTQSPSGVMSPVPPSNIPTTQRKSFTVGLSRFERRREAFCNSSVCFGADALRFIVHLVQLVHAQEAALACLTAMQNAQMTPGAVEAAG